MDKNTHGFRSGCGFGDHAARNYGTTVAELVALNSCSQRKMMPFSAEANTALIGGVLLGSPVPSITNTNSPFLVQGHPLL